MKAFFCLLFSFCLALYTKSAPPIVNAGTNKFVFLPSTQTLLSGSVSVSPGNTISSTVWSQLSGPNTAIINTPGNTNTLITNLIQGVYVFQLLATDNLNQTGFSTITITVTTGPIANVGGNQTINLPLDSIVLNSINSSDASGTINSYSWTQKSGPTISTIRTPSSSLTSIANLKVGTYVFKLTIA